MVERDAAARFRVAGLGQPPVPADQVGPAAIQKGLGHCTCGPAPRAGLVEDALHRDRVHRRLSDARRVPGPWRIGGQRGGGPPRRAGEVAVDAVGEDDVRDHPVGPLRRQQRVQFDDGPLDAQRRQSDRDERGIPAPHVRVQQRRGGGHRAQVVAAQQVCGAGRELCGSEAVVGWHRIHHATRGGKSQIDRVATCRPR